MTRIDRSSRVMPASPATVFQALIDPVALENWLPPEGMKGIVQQLDPRPGGELRMTLHYPEAGDSAGKSTADTDIVHALYIEVIPGRRVAFEVNFVSEDPAYAGTMVMFWELAETDGGTEVVFRAENVPAGISAEDHAAGLASSLRQLETYLASGSQSSPQPGS